MREMTVGDGERAARGDAAAPEMGVDIAAAPPERDAL
jgi:hypothetical protein